MKGTIAIAAALAVSTLHAADNLSSMFSEGKVKGEIRAFHIDRDDNTKADNQVGTALGGKLIFETASLNGLRLSAGFYTTNRILDDLEKDAVGPNTTLFRNDKASYSILGEAALSYEMKESKTSIKIGRQRLDTPLAGSDDARMLPTLFEAAVLHNNDIKNTTLALAHVSQIAPGSFANAYAGGILGATSGYTAVGANNAAYQGRFANMGSWAVGEKTDGVTALAAIYKGEGFGVQVWDYYAHDILNAVYAQANLSWKCLISDTIKPSLALQVIKQDTLGDKLLSKITGDGEIDSMYYGVQAGFGIGALKLALAYSEQTSNESGDAAYKNATITPFGGMPAFTQGMVTRHQFLAGTKASKVAATYGFKEQGLNLTTTLYYAMFEMDANSGYGTARNVYESGFDIIHNLQTVKNLQLRLRGNFPNEFGNARSWDEYRLIATYSF